MRSIIIQNESLSKFGDGENCSTLELNGFLAMTLYFKPISIHLTRQNFYLCQEKYRKNQNS